MNTRYQIIAAATGEGGFGRIDKAKDTVLERYIALKTLDPLFKESPSPEDKERFKREAKTLANLSHPNIPAIYDVVFPETNAEFKLIFEWIEGKTMRRFLDERGVMSLEQIKKWFANICSALTHAHNKGIIHRDIKPANLIITTNEESCYLVDFGISLRQSDWQRLTPSSYPVGTPGYMSPQQQRGEEVDASDDVYSLGMVLYECLSGHLPTVGEYNALNTFNEIIPPAIDELVLSCLREDKVRRLSSAAAFFQELTEALQPYANFSETLSHASLYEIQAALNQMDSGRYAELPTGQRLFLMATIKDLIKLDQFNMRNAVASLLSELVRVGHQTREKDYAFVIEQSLIYGYEKQYNSRWIGNTQTKESLNRVAKECQQPAHKILSEELLKFIESAEQFEAKEKWYYQELKIFLRNLLINIHCADKHAELLSEYLEKVNDLSH
jgi:serine/threonine protein kinase